MKRTLLYITALMLTIAAMGQTLNVKVGTVVYQFPATQTGEMTYADSETLTIMGKTFSLSDIDEMTVDNTNVTANLVDIAYTNSGSAMVTIAGNVAQYVTPTINGNHVTIVQTNTEAVDEDEITYQLSGTTTDGGSELDGDYKCTIALAGLTLTNPSGAAINISNGASVESKGKVITLSADSLYDENDFDNPDKIHPVESLYNKFSKSFEMTFKPNSFTILRVNVGRTNKGSIF